MYQQHKRVSSDHSTSGTILAKQQLAVLLLLTFRKLLKGQSVLWLKLNKLDLGGEKSWPKASGSRTNTTQLTWDYDRKTKMSVQCIQYSHADILLVSLQFLKKKYSRDHNVHKHMNSTFRQSFQCRASQLQSKYIYVQVEQAEQQHY